MHLAWVLYGGLNQATGGTIYDRVIVEALRARGHTVAILSLCQRGRLAGILAGDALRARIGDVDAVVGDELCFPEIAAAFPRIRGVRRVLLVHHLTCWEHERSFGDRAFAQILEQCALRAADAVIATSHTSAERLGRDHRVRAAHVIQPGADRLPRASRTRGDRLRLLFVGTWTERKGLLRLLQALRVAPSGWSLSIAGDAARDPRYTAKVLAILREPFAQQIVVHGRVGDAALAELYASHDVLVLPTSFEGFGMVISEALHAGLEVITTRAGATVEASGGSRRVIFASDLTDALRERLARSAPVADEPTLALPSWSDAAARFEEVLR
ncbi:MAG: glycosyltransferase family 4 protein [Deltaproteobacteria bacterium]|nr:glycosyltransferase family 4 protein [Deltaproteobacteria bacterium]